MKKKTRKKRYSQNRIQRILLYVLLDITAKDMEIVLLQGKYTFVNITDVQQYECSPGYRLVVLTDGNFTGLAQHNNFIGEFYPY